MFIALSCIETCIKKIACVEHVNAIVVSNKIGRACNTSYIYCIGRIAVSLSVEAVYGLCNGEKKVLIHGTGSLCIYRQNGNLVYRVRKQRKGCLNIHLARCFSFRWHAWKLLCRRRSHGSFRSSPFLINNLNVESELVPERTPMTNVLLVSRRPALAGGLA
jgi:hypothetical protein